MKLFRRTSYTFLVNDLDRVMVENLCCNDERFVVCVVVDVVCRGCFAVQFSWLCIGVCSWRRGGECYER